MNRTKIEWTDFTWNPVTGCRNKCPYCYARRIAERFKGTKAFPNGFEPTLHDDRFFEPISYGMPSKIFVCSMGELFGNWIPDEWIEAVLATCRLAKHHTFQFLTKCPWNLPKWNPWPENAWVGATAVDFYTSMQAIDWLALVEAKIRFLSLEPLLHNPAIPRALYPIVHWVIVGAQTNPYLPPERQWIEEIIEATSQAKISLFLKDNLFKAYPDLPRIQEFPK